MTCKQAWDRQGALVPYILPVCSQNPGLLPAATAAGSETICVVVCPSDQPKLCWSTAPRARPFSLILHSNPSIAFWIDLLDDCQMTSRGLNLDSNLNSAAWPIGCKDLSALNSLNNLCVELEIILGQLKLENTEIEESSCELIPTLIQQTGKFKLLCGNYRITMNIAACWGTTNSPITVRIIARTKFNKCNHHCLETVSLDSLFKYITAGWTKPLLYHQGMDIAPLLDIPTLISKLATANHHPLSYWPTITSLLLKTSPKLQVLCYISLSWASQSASWLSQ